MHGRGVAEEGLCIEELIRSVLDVVYGKKWKNGNS